MPNWKKIIVSGSDATLSSVTSSGGFFGTASWAQNAVSASYAPDTTFPYTGSALITGSLGVTGSISTTSNLTATEITASNGNVRVNTFFKGFLLPQYGYIGNGFATGFPGGSDAYMNWDNGNIGINVPSANQIALVRAGVSRIIMGNTANGGHMDINVNESNSHIRFRPQDTNTLTTLYLSPSNYYASIGFPYNSESLASGSLHVRNKSNKNAAIVAEGGTTGSTLYTFRAYNSASSDLFSIRDDGYTTLSGSLVVTGSIIGSLLGTASWAQSASQADTASYVTTLRAGGTANSVQRNASGILDGSNRFTFDGTSVSIGNGATLSATGSLLGTSSYADQALSSSFALTASYVANASSFPYTGSAIISGSLIITGSTISTQGFTGSLQGTSSFATSAGKAGAVSSASFGGSPFTSSVTFGTAFANTSYAVTITGEDDRVYTVNNKQTTGFTINTNSSVLFTGSVYWMAMSYNS